jgi:hypothetical protein
LSRSLTCQETYIAALPWLTVASILLCVLARRSVISLLYLFLAFYMLYNMQVTLRACVRVCVCVHVCIYT